MPPGPSEQDRPHASEDDVAADPAETTELQLGGDSDAQTIKHDPDIDAFVTQHFSLDSKPDALLISEDVAADDDSLGAAPTVSVSSLTEDVFRRDDARALGDFTLVGKLGSGGFGVVYRATDQRLDRDVAIKVIKGDKIGNRSRRDNFQAEAKAVAQLRHPNIVPVHQAGEVSSGQAFIVYQFIDGPNLRGFMRTNGAFEPAEAVSLLTQIADGLGYAHQCGIVHRDVKPENILIEAATGEPHIADFGCATRQSYRQTVQGNVLRNVFVGTPQYFSPEQAAGTSHLADARSDVWALGVVMDEMLTRRRTFREEEKSAQTITDLLESIQTTRPRPLSERCPVVDRDLNAIWAKCLASKPDDRYQTAKELAADLRRWSGKRPVQARPIGLPERVVRWSRRNPLVASSLAATFLAILTAWLVTYFSLQSVRRANSEKARYAVQLLVEARPSELASAVDQLRSASFRQESRAVLQDEWSAVAAQIAQGDVDPKTERRAWRISLGLAAVNAAAGASDRPRQAEGASDSFLALRIVSDRTSPAELQAACELLLSTESDTGALNGLAERLETSAPSSSLDGAARLRALCALGLLNRAPSDSAALVSRLLYELASVDPDQATAWVGLAQQQFAGLREQLTALQETLGERESDRAVIDQLLVAISDQPEDLIRQIVKSERPLAGILPTLKRRVDETGRLPKFDRFLALASDGSRVAPASLAKLWIALLYVADLERDFSEINQDLLRLDDPSNRSAETSFVCDAYQSGLDRSRLLALAERWSMNYDRRLVSVLLALGDYPPPANIADRTKQWLTEIWINDPHSATHSACDWLMRNWQIETDVNRLPNDYDLAVDAKSRNWRLADGRLFVRIERPEQPFLLGTPAEELTDLNPELRNPEFSSYEVSHPHQVLGDFEIAALEVSVAEFEQFLDDRVGVRRLDRVGNRIRENPTKSRAAEADVLRMPADGLNWYDAVEYCIWLSKKHGLESCYGKLEDVSDAFEELERSRSVLGCDRSKSGYRLPTNGEWELACRAGTSTRWPFGDDANYIVDYAACSIGGGKMLVRGSLRPNAWGLFDMLGNAAEMTDSPSEAVSAGQLSRDSKVRSADSNKISFDVRGGAYSESPLIVRAARRIAAANHQDYLWTPKNLGLGVRLVRTLKVAEDAP